MALLDNVKETLKSAQSAAKEAIDTNAPKVKDFVATNAPKVQETISNTIDKVQDSINAKVTEAADKKQAEDFKKHAPIFKEDMKGIDLKFERLIRIIDHDKREDDERYKDSIGFTEIIDDAKLKTFYYKYAEDLGLSFYPRLHPSVYIKDPCFPYKFIDIDQYYDYMNEVRVNELTTLAQSLGASHVKISYRESTKNSSENAANVDGSLINIEKVAGTFDFSKDSHKSLEILAETSFSSNGINSKEIPKLLYFEGESDILALIDMAKSGSSRLDSRTYSLHASSSSGISFKEALDIASTIKKIGFSEDFERKSKIEKDAILEYSITF